MTAVVQTKSLTNFRIQSESNDEIQHTVSFSPAEVDILRRNSEFLAVLISQYGNNESNDPIILIEKHPREVIKFLFQIIENVQTE